jgi:hypothetical protein
MIPDGLCFRHVPKSVLTKDGKRMGKAWDAFVESAGDQQLVKYRDGKLSWERALNMRRRLRSNRDVVDLLRSGVAEQTYVGECAVTGLTFQSRADWVNVLDDGVLCPDLKSAWTLKNWQGQAMNCGLHVQAVTLGGMIGVAHDRDVEVVFIAQDKEPSYSSETHVFEQAALEEGIREYVKSVSHYAQCLETGVWEHEGFGKRVTITVPDWKKKQIMDREYAESGAWKDIDSF